jgi:peptidoglycan-associated lipoprotein
MKLRLLVLALTASVLTACGGSKALNGEETFNQDAADQNNQSGNLYNGESTGYKRTDGFNAADLQANAGKYKDSDINDPSSALANRTLYFKFNTSEMDQSARDAAIEHAKFLATRPTVQIVLEGHADERGTREYNIALGQSRAEAVKRTLLLYGVRPSQLRLVSYGEEKPAVMGHSDEAWAKNRRVELRYKG